MTNPARTVPRECTVIVDTPMQPPEWALLERQLLSAEAEACRTFFEKYFDERGYLLCVPRWGGDDGPDDAAENLLNWTMLYALGAPSDVLDLYRKGWDGHLRQYTEAKTTEVEMGREGMYFKEFPVMFDWFHHGEWLSAFILEGLCSPANAKFQQRARRYAGFYMNEDPLAPNYDPHLKLIKSMFNGSRGPLLRKATGLDWAGDPIEIAGRFKPGHGERNYEQMVEHFKDYNDVVGDHPMNLAATTLGLEAYMLTGESKYRDWLLDYVDAWIQRTEQNGGIIPSNIGLDGTIGGECDGKWWGGVYGWGFSVWDPGQQRTVHRTAFQNRCFHGFGNAYLLTGDPRYLEVWRGLLDKVNANARTESGITTYPHSYGDDGWYNFQERKFDHGGLEVFYWSMRDDDRQRAPASRWLDYLEGKDPQYPVDALRADFEAVRARMEEVRNDQTTPDTRMSDDPNHLNPAATGALTQMMLGGLPTGREGSVLHARIRYFDPERRRAGIPEDVASLVEQMDADSVTVSLVNLNPVHERTAIVQAGAYGEHQVESVEVHGGMAAGPRGSNGNGHTAQRSTTNGVRRDGHGVATHVGHRHFTVRIAPGAGARLKLRLRRYVNQPSLAFPWA